jgi:hypothetical protein
MHELIAWLNNPNYKEGVELFLKNSRNKQLNHLFRYEAETEYKRQRLTKEIQLLVTKQEAKPVIQYDTKPVQQIGVGWPPKPIEDVVVAALYEQWKPLYDEMLNLQARVYDVAEQGEQQNDLKRMEACEMAHRICDLDDSCDEIYAKRDYYYTNGSLPAEQSKRELVGDPVKWAVELQNLKRYERQYKLLLKKQPQHRLADKRAQKLKQCQENIAYYSKLLKIDV